MGTRDLQRLCEAGRRGADTWLGCWRNPQAALSRFFRPGCVLLLLSPRDAPACRDAAACVCLVRSLLYEGGGHTAMGGSIQTCR